MPVAMTVFTSVLMLHLFDLVIERRQHYGGLRSAVLQGMDKVLFAEQRVYLRCDSARLPHGELADDDLGTIRHQQCNAVALLYSNTGQRPGKQIDIVRELAVGYGVAFEPHHHGIRTLPGVLLNDVKKGDVGIGLQGKGNAFIVISQPRTFNHFRPPLPGTTERKLEWVDYITHPPGENSKFQAPNSKQIPNLKYQTKNVFTRSVATWQSTGWQQFKQSITTSPYGLLVMTC